MYICNHMIRHDGTLYQKGQKIELKHEDAQSLLKHKAITEVGEGESVPLSGAERAAAEAAAEAAERAAKEAEEKAAAEAAAKEAEEKAGKKASK